jgi:hypothetical protein
MKHFTRKVLVAASPAFGAAIGISVLRAADLPFPPGLAVDALPQWAIFVAVVHTATSLCMFTFGRLLGQEATKRANEPNTVA